MKLTPVVLAALSLTACESQSSTPPPASPAPPVEVAAGELRFLAPAEWVREEPSSSMRVAQFRLPGEAALVVYWFGGGGGGVEANIERWIGQFEQADGGESSAVAVSASREHDGLAFHTLELYGTYVAETSPGSGVFGNEPEYGLLACVVESPAGFYYVKLVGPGDVVRGWKDDWEVFLASTRLSDA